MRTIKKIALSGAICATIVYEVILFSSLITAAHSSLSLSVFFTFLFSLVGASPIIIILLLFTRPPFITRYGEVEDNNRDSPLEN